jgi:SAM-dependent methyltransferase
VLDLGCGIGHSFEALAPRESVGVDIDARSRRQIVYDWLLTRYRRRRSDPRAAEIGPEDFELRAERVERAFDLVAVCRRPRN